MVMTQAMTSRPNTVQLTEALALVAPTPVTAPATVWVVGRLVIAWVITMPAAAVVAAITRLLSALLPRPIAIPMMTALMLVLVHRADPRAAPGTKGRRRRARPRRRDPRPGLRPGAARRRRPRQPRGPRPRRSGPLDEAETAAQRGAARPLGEQTRSRHGMEPPRAQEDRRQRTSRRPLGGGMHEASASLVPRPVTLVGYRRIQASVRQGGPSCVPGVLGSSDNAARGWLGRRETGRTLLDGAAKPAASQQATASDTTSTGLTPTGPGTTAPASTRVMGFCTDRDYEIFLRQAPCSRRC